MGSSKKKKANTISSTSEPTKKKRRKETDADDIITDIPESHECLQGLNLIRTLQNKDTSTERKIEYAYNFLKGIRDSKKLLEDNDCMWVENSNLVEFICEWVQSTLMSKQSDSNSHACFDSRSWLILKMCLHSQYLHRINFSPTLMRPINTITSFLATKLFDRSANDDDVRMTQGALKNKSSNSLGMPEKKMQETMSLVREFTEVLELLLSVHGRNFRPTLELWSVAALSAVVLARKHFSEKHIGDDELGVVIEKLVYVLLESFGCYIGMHPSPKTVFSVIMEKLLEPLLSLLAVGSRLDDCRVMKSIEDILCSGLFHAAHIDGYFDVCRLNNSGDANSINKKGKEHGKKGSASASYHKMLFQKLGKMKQDSLRETGTLLKLFLRSKNSKENVSTDLYSFGKMDLSRTSTEKILDDKKQENSVGADGKSSNKSVFGIFAGFMKVFMTEIEKFGNCSIVPQEKLSHISSILSGVNGLLSVVKDNDIYIPTKDTSDHAHLSYLKSLYRSVFQLGTLLLGHFLKSKKSSKICVTNQMAEIMKDVVVALNLLMEIEYQVGNEHLLDLWLLLLSYLSVDSCWASENKQSIYTRVIGISCKIIQIYGELRQVDRPLLQLFVSIRNFVSCSDSNKDIHLHLSQFLSSHSLNLAVEAVSIMCCSQEFLHAIGSVISAIPEGQVANTVRLLKVDAMETFEWLKNSNMVKKCKSQKKLAFCMIASEVAGKSFCELYASILNSASVTANNSILVGNSICELISSLGPYLSTLLDEISDNAENKWERIMFAITGNKIPENSTDTVSETASFIGGSWILVFFLRLYLSCRSTYRQCICLMPPKMALKSSLSMGDQSTGCSGNHWIQLENKPTKGYFYWVCKATVTVSTVIAGICESQDQDSIKKNPTLIYVLHEMAIQRLVDLNRDLVSFEYSVDKVSRAQRLQIDCGSDQPYDKQLKRLHKRIKVLRIEATFLTEFILTKSELKSFNKNQSSEWNPVLGTISEISLATVVWQLLCNNVDAWSQYTSKKTTKKFITALLKSFLTQFETSCVNSNSCEDKCQLRDQPNMVTVEELSSRLLRNSVLYEQEFFYRYFGKRICWMIRKSLPSKLESLKCLSVSMNETILGSFNEWPNIDMFLNETQDVKNRDMAACTSDEPHLIAEDSYNVTTDKEIFRDWTNLLYLLSWLPKRYVGVKSLTMFACHILNIERFLLTTLHQAQQLSNHEGSAAYQFFVKHSVEFLRLFLACRKALKSVVISSNEEEFLVKSSLLSILFEGPVGRWLLKSTDVLVQLLLKLNSKNSSKENKLTTTTSINILIFSILEHTSQSVMYICEDAFRKYSKSLICNVESPEDTEIKDVCYGSAGSIPSLESNKEKLKFYRTFDILGDSLKIEAENLFLLLKDEKFRVNSSSREQECVRDLLQKVKHSSEDQCQHEPNSISWIQLSSLIGSIKGFIWGLASALEDLDDQCRKDSTKSLRWHDDLLSEWLPCVAVFESLINSCINKFLTHNASRNMDSIQMPEESKIDKMPQSNLQMNSQESQHEGKETEGYENFMEEEKTGDERAVLGDFMELDNDEENFAALEKSKIFLHEREIQSLEHTETKNLNTTLLTLAVKGENPEQANILGELFMALAGIVKLKHLSSSPKVFASKKNSHLGSTIFIDMHIHGACWLTSEAVEIMSPSNVTSFGWLVGVIRYLECIGNFIPYMNPTIPRTILLKLFNLHIKGIASLSCLSSEEEEGLMEHTDSFNRNNLSNVTTMNDSSQSCDSSNNNLKQVQCAIKRSFTSLVSKPIELHLLLVLQSLERCLAGVSKSHNMVSELHTGSRNGGKASRSIAAAVECLDLALESVSGPKRIKLLAKYSPSFIAALINIIIHLQGAHIFFGRNLVLEEDDYYANPLVVILGCVKVLSKVASKHTLYPVSAYHVGQLSAIPAVLFQFLYSYRATKAAKLSNRLVASKLPHSENGTAAKDAIVKESKQSVLLFVYCCKLLCALLRHHKRETGHCMSLLEDSLRVLLFCLEIADFNGFELPCTKYWTIFEGVECAAWLRRVYEELGQHKETLGRYCTHMLSDYICVISGFGPQQAGLAREIDEALRPGVYALVEACSLEDLQQLHAVLGEGPRRNALKSLKIDYEKNYKYSGKI